MPSSTHLAPLFLLALSPLAALAKTDLSGCTSFTSTVTVNPTAHEYGNVYQSLVYYDPDTLEVCSVPDCGGGRAPPKTGVPGCPLYSGTATPTPSFLSADPLAPVTTTAASSVAVETTAAAATTNDADSYSSSLLPDAVSLSSSSSSSSSSTTVIVVTATDRSSNATGASGIAQATGGSAGAATGSPSGTVEISSGSMARVAVGGLSGALGLAVAVLV